MACGMDATGLKLHLDAIHCVLSRAHYLDGRSISNDGIVLLLYCFVFRYHVALQFGCRMSDMI